MGIKALAIAVLQGNQRRNQRETQSFLANKSGKPKHHQGKLIVIIPQRQQDFCLAHRMFNTWRGYCPCSLDDCMISRILDSGGNIERIRSLEIGHGVTSDEVINLWLDTGEPAADLLKNPCWLICMAEHITRHRK